MNSKIILVLVNAFLMAFSYGLPNSTSYITRIDRQTNSLVTAPRTSSVSNTSTHVEKKWVSELFLEAKNVFDMNGDVNGECKRDFAVYQQFLKNQTVWAVRMSESAQWPSFGLFAGITHHLGNWDECFKAEPLNFSPQYCLVSAKFNFTKNPSLDENNFNWGSWPNEQLSAWDVLQLWAKDETRLNRQIVSWALCIPSSCRPSDLEIALNETLSPIFKKYDLTASANVQSNFCKVKKGEKFPFSFYVTGFTLLSGILAIIFGTIYEFYAENDLPANGVKANVLTFVGFFSFRKNWKNLQKYTPENTYPIIHIFKIITAFFVLSGHRFMLLYFYPTFNTEIHEMYRQSFNFELVQTSVVDIFITISGFLMFHYSFESIRKGGPIYIVIYIILRWLRMITIPVFLIVIMLFFFEHLSDGPLWNHYFEMHVALCKRNWWTTILAINNIVEPDKPCMPQTWYLSVDLQLTILGAIILFIMSKNMKVGLLVCFGMIASSVASSFIIILLQNYYAIFRFTIPNTREFINVRDYHMFYVATYNRVGPYILGILAALLSRKLKEKKYKFSATAATIILLSTFIIGIVFTCYGFVFYQSRRPYDVIENAAYGALNRILFALPFASLFCIYFTSGLGVFNNILENKIFVPYGRLVLGVYLLGSPLQAAQVISLKTYMPVQDKILLYWMATGDFVWAYFFALITYLTIEAPVNNILKFFQDKLLRISR